MWGFKYTSKASIFNEQCRVGVHFEASTPSGRLSDLLSGAVAEQRCKCYFFDVGTERILGPAFQAFLRRDGIDRRRMFIGLTFPKSFDFHKSQKVVTEKIKGAIDGADHFLPWQVDFVTEQEGPELAANLVPISITAQQKQLASYCHGRQVEVIARLEVKGLGTEECTRSESCLQSIGRQSNMTPGQVLTSWAMHRGLVSLLPITSLYSPGLQETVAAYDKSKAELGARLRAIFTMLHPFAAYPKFYSPNNSYSFSLSKAQLVDISDLDQVLMMTPSSRKTRGVLKSQRPAEDDHALAGAGNDRVGPEDDRPGSSSHVLVPTDAQREEPPPSRIKEEESTKFEEVKLPGKEGPAEATHTEPPSKVDAGRDGGLPVNADRERNGHDSTGILDSSSGGEKGTGPVSKGTGRERIDSTIKNSRSRTTISASSPTASRMALSDAQAGGQAWEGGSGGVSSKTERRPTTVERKGGEPTTEQTFVSRIPSDVPVGNAQGDNQVGDNMDQHSGGSSSKKGSRELTDVAIATSTQEKDQQDQRGGMTFVVARDSPIAMFGGIPTESFLGGPNVRGYLYDTDSNDCGEGSPSKSGGPNQGGRGGRKHHHHSHHGRSKARYGSVHLNLGGMPHRRTPSPPGEAAPPITGASFSNPPAQVPREEISGKKAFAAHNNNSPSTMVGSSSNFPGMAMFTPTGGQNESSTAFSDQSSESATDSMASSSSFPSSFSANSSSASSTARGGETSATSSEGTSSSESGEEGSRGRPTLGGQVVRQSPLQSA